MLILGIDLGNGYTKYKGGCFASQIMVGAVDSNGKKRKNVHSVKFNGMEYTVGTGKPFLGTDRYFGESYKTCLLTAIALASGSTPNPIQAKVVVGLPVDFHDALAEQLREHILSYGVCDIEVNTKDYIIEIVDCEVFIEGALPLKDGDDSHMITIDIGAGTVNVIEWMEQEVIARYTFSESFYKLYTDITGLLNRRHLLGLNPEDGERYLGVTEVNTKKGVAEVPEIPEMTKKFVEGTASYIESNFGVAECKTIKILGGGATATYTMWKEVFPKAVLVNRCQQVNQEVYESVALSAFGEDEE